MDGWENFNETSLPEKKDYCSHLNMEDITDEDYASTKKDFEIKKLGKYHNLYVQNDILFLADVIDNFRNMYFEIHELNPAKFLSLLDLD